MTPLQLLVVVVDYSGHLIAFVQQPACRRQFIRFSHIYYFLGFVD
jgi:hypothetical protein